MKKAVYTIDILGWEGAAKSLTFPAMEKYAQKIGADFIVIKNRAFPTYPANYEKMQIHKLGISYDWNIYFDPDVLIHPNMPDLTTICPESSIGHIGMYGTSSWFELDSIFKNDTVVIKDNVFELDGDGRIKVGSDGNPNIIGVVDRVAPREFSFCDAVIVTSRKIHDIWKPVSFSFDQSLVMSKKPLMDNRDKFVTQWNLARNVAEKHISGFQLDSVLKKLGAQNSDDWYVHLDLSVTNKKFTVDNILNYLEKGTLWNKQVIL